MDNPASSPDHHPDGGQEPEELDLSRHIRVDRLGDEIFIATYPDDMPVTEITQNLLDALNGLMGDGSSLRLVIGPDLIPMGHG